MARHRSAFGAHLGFELDDDRDGSFLTRGLAGVDVETVDRALDIEQDVDLLTASSASGKIGDGLSDAPRRTLVSTSAARRSVSGVGRPLRFLRKDSEPK